MNKVVVAVVVVAVDVVVVVAVVVDDDVVVVVSVVVDDDVVVVAVVVLYSAVSLAVAAATAARGSTGCLLKFKWGGKARPAQQLQ